MEHFSSYIKVFVNQNKETTISIADRELFDFIEDYLIEECDFNIGYCKMDDEQKVYDIVLEKAYTIEQVNEIITMLDKKEIENIIKLNN